MIETVEDGWNGVWWGVGGCGVGVVPNSSYNGSEQTSKRDTKYQDIFLIATRMTRVDL